DRAARYGSAHRPCPRDRGAVAAPSAARAAPRSRAGECGMRLHDHAARLRALALFLPALLLATVLPLPASAQDATVVQAPPMVRTVRLSVRVVGNGGDARIELPLLQSDAHQTLLAEKLLPRGFQV